MEESYQHIEEIIAKSLAGESSADEQALLDSWRSESDENRRYFDDLKRVWAAAGAAKTPAGRTIDTEAALLKVKQRTGAEQQGAAPRGRSISISFLMRAAAVLILAAGAFFLLRPASAPVEIASDAKNILTDTLTDGSVVTLNRNSGITPASGFNKKERRLKLRGEAYFEVSSNPERPFVVEVQELEVKVVGTAFNVDDQTDPNAVIVTVTHGKVLVKDAYGAEILLVAGEQAVYNRETRTLQRQTGPVNADVPVYKSRIFHFDATPLAQVVRQLNAAYGVDIRLENKVLENCMLTGDYENKPLARVLQLVSDAFSLQIERQPNDVYILKGSGCGE